MSGPIVTLLTDFGLTDEYVGAMKGVILSICPSTRVIDLSHGIAPQAVAHGAEVLRRCAPWYPPGTTHIAVVDPGVGTDRDVVVIETGGHRLVGPDNGLLVATATALAAGDGYLARRWDNDDLVLHPRSQTFHGRDIFAPLGAHLAAGTPLSEVGPVVHDLIEPALADAHRKDTTEIVGAILYVDHFGNLITNVPGDWVAQMARPVLELDGRPVCHGLRRTYADVPPGQPLMTVGSSGYLDVSVRGGSAAQQLGASAADPLVIVDS